MPCPEVPIQQIFGTECIGDSLPKINNNFTALGDATCNLITKVNALSSASVPDASVNVFDSPTIDLDWNSSTRTLSAIVNPNLRVTTLTATDRIECYGGGAITSNTTIGRIALVSNTTGYNNTASGYSALNNNTTGYYNTAVGAPALLNNTTGYNNTAVGANTLASNDGHNNTASGYSALNNNTTGYYNTAVGAQALQNNITGNSNTASGYAALLNNTAFSNVGGFGYNAQVTASNQIRIGDSNITSVTCQTNSWSDERDKADIRDTVLGLGFIKELRPVDFKWDYREDYRPEAPKAPEQDASEKEKVAYKKAQEKWLEDVKLANITHDGSKKRNRYHHGLIAQEVKAVIEKTGIDFGGFQDHTINGGDEAMTLGYTELIGPLIKAVQELDNKTKDIATLTETVKFLNKKILDLESKLK